MSELFKKSLAQKRRFKNPSAKDLYLFSGRTTINIKREKLQDASSMWPGQYEDFESGGWS